MPLILSSPAYLWDGYHQLLGTLELWESEVIFKLSDFKYSHLNLHIAMKNISKVEEFLIFDLAKNGLRIQNKDGKYDLFVLEESEYFKKMLINQLK
jgi:hypothetical protein